MKKQAKQYPMWFILGITAVVLLTACTAVLSGGGIAVEMPADEEVDAGKEDVEDSPAGQLPAEKSSSNQAGNKNVTILTEDNRSDRLRTLTRDWQTNWNKHSVSYDEILSGGPPRDGIRSIDNPTFINPDDAAGWLADNEPVIALELNGDARAYPLQIITWHEIVNDEVDGVPAVVTF